MMHWQYTLYILSLFIATVISIALAFYAWRRRPVPGAALSALLMLAVAAWSLGYALEMANTDLPSKIFWGKVQYLGIVIVPVAWLLLVLQYIGRERWLTRRNLALLAIDPLITLVLAWTNERHGLIWSHVGLDESGLPLPLDLTYGAWFWVHCAFSYLLLLLGTIWLILMLSRSPHLYRQQSGALLLGALAPWVGNALYLSGLFSLDLTPLAFMVSGIAFAWGLLRFRLLDIMPVAHRAVMDGMGDGVIVLDSQDRILDLNPAAQRIVGTLAPDAIGRPLARILADHADLIECFHDVAETCAEIALGEGEAQQYYKLHISPLSDRRGHIIGRLVVLYDITASRQAEELLRAQKQLFENLVAVARATAEQPSLEATLQNALDVASTLTGAERGSLFLLDENGAVTHSILGLGQEKPETWDTIVANVMGKGLAGWVTRHRQAALIYDAHHDERWLPLPYEHYAARSVLTVPIVSGPVVLGVLNLLHSQPGHFSPEHLHLMQAAADQMALAVRNAQMFEMLRHIADRHTMLYEVLRTIAGQTDPEAVTRVAVETISELAGWTDVAIALPDENETHWIISAVGGSLLPIAGLKFTLEQGIIGRAFRTGLTQLVPDVSADQDYIAGHPDIRSELAVPLRRGERTLGVLNLESSQLAAFDADDVLLAESLVEAVALALDNARLYEETSQRAADLNSLYTVARMVSRSLVLEDVLSQALSSALLSLGFDAGVISLADPDGRLRTVVEFGLPSLLSRRLRLEGLEGTLCAYVHAQQEVLALGDLRQGAPIDTSAMADLGFRAYVGIPLLHQRKSLGSISLFARQPRSSSTYDLALLTTTGHQVATAVANARLFRAVAEEHSRLQSLIESSRDGIILVGVDARVLFINAPAVELLRLPGQPEDWIDRTTSDVLVALRHYAPGVVRDTMAEVRRIRKGDDSPGEGEYEVPPRTIHWLNLPVLAETTPLGRLLVLRDVTEERLLEKMRDDLTHTMVHDLRNPLAAISNSLQLLGLAAENFSPEQLFMLGVARSSTQRMLKLVNDILVVSRLESGKMPLERAPVSLADLIAETLRGQSLLAADKELRLESDVPPALPPAWADAGLIERVLQNLVDNAIKFTSTGGSVKVAVRQSDGGTREPGDQETAEYPYLCVSVADDGPGVPPALQSRLFQKFVVGLREKGGSGLGLAFCKLVVEAHEGRIWFESEPGQGTTFTFTLPALRGSDTAGTGERDKAQ